jgi:adenosylcobinamide-GDP ribazoletransferase
MSSVSPDAPPAGRSVVPRAHPHQNLADAAAERRAPLRTLATAPAFALQFLTIVPPLVRRAPRPADLGASDAFFPVVGLLLGQGLAGADWVLGGLVTPLVRDILLVVLLAAATGALHLDGFVDTFDGLFVPGGSARRLEIMRDPRAGTFGVVAVVLLLGLKIAALGALLPELRTAGLILAPCLGRWAIVTATWRFPYARKEGLGRGFKDGIRPLHVTVAGASAALVAGWLAGPFGIALFAGASLGVLALGSVMSARLGGLTGDTYGALCELTEVMVWLACGLRFGLVAA